MQKVTQMAWIYCDGFIFLIFDEKLPKVYSTFPSLNTMSEIGAKRTGEFQQNNNKKSKIGIHLTYPLNYPSHTFDRGT